MKRINPNLYLLLLTTALLFLLTPAQAQSINGFSEQVGCHGYVTFTAQQQNYTSFTWAFGDNSTGSGATIVHQYAPGIYNAMLTAQSAVDSDVYVQQVFIGEYIQQQITGPT